MLKVAGVVLIAVTIVSWMIGNMIILIVPYGLYGIAIVMEVYETLYNVKEDTKSNLNESASHEPKKEVKNVDIRTLSYEEAISLLISLGCPSDLEHRLNKVGYNHSNFNGKILLHIENVNEFREECSLHEMRLPVTRSIFAELQELKLNGIPEEKMERIRNYVPVKTRATTTTAGSTSFLRFLEEQVNQGNSENSNQRQHRERIISFEKHEEPSHDISSKERKANNADDEKEQKKTLEFHYIPDDVILQKADNLPDESDEINKVSNELTKENQEHRPSSPKNEKIEDISLIEEEDHEDEEDRVKKELAIELNQQIESKISLPPKYECEMTLTGHSMHIYCMIILSNTRIATGADDGTVRIWNLSYAVCEHTLRGHSSIILSLIQLLDGRIASASHDRTVKIWDPMTAQCHFTLGGHAGSVVAVIQLKDHRVVTGSRDCTLKIWNLLTQSCEMTLTGHRSYVRSVKELVDGQIISWADCDYDLRIWNITTGQCTKMLSGLRSAVCCLIQLKDQRIVASSADNLVRIWDINTGESVQTIETSSAINAGPYLPILQLNDGRLAIGNRNCTVNIWNLKTSRCEITLNTPGWGSTIFMLQLDDGRLAVSFSSNVAEHRCSISIWNLSTGECEDTLIGHTQGVSKFFKLVEGRIVSYSQDRTIKIWKQVVNL
jgi:WD40 repeat protein